MLDDVNDVGQAAGGPSTGSGTNGGASGMSGGGGGGAASLVAAGGAGAGASSGGGASLQQSIMVPLTYLGKFDVAGEYIACEKKVVTNPIDIKAGTSFSSVFLFFFFFADMLTQFVNGTVTEVEVLVLSVSLFLKDHSAFRIP